MNEPAINVPAWLKPENGWVGAALGTWLDFAKGGLATRFLLLWFVILYTAFQVVSFASVELNAGVLEVYALGQHPAAGYAQQAPLAALMTAGWFAAFPHTEWSFHLLAMVNAAIGLVAVDRIAVGYVEGDKRIAVLLLLLLTPFYQFLGQRFGPNATMLSLWPIATLCFLRAFATRDMRWSAAAGATAALALLGRYYAIFLIAGFVAAALMHPGRRGYLRSPSPWIALTAFAVVLAPHVQWAMAAGFSPFEAAEWRAGGAFAAVLWKDAVYVAGSIGYVAVAVAVYWLAVRPDRATLRETLWPAGPDGRMLIVLLAVPLVLPAVVAPLTGMALSPLWSMGGWFLLPLVLLRPKAAEFSRTAAIRMTALIVLITIGALAMAPWLAWRRHTEGTATGREYFRQVSVELTNAWHLGTAMPLRIVMGDPALTAAVAFYSPDHPDAMAGFDLGPAVPWITPERLAAEGWAAICRADDEACTQGARNQAAGRSDVQFINFATTNRYRNQPGKLGRFFFLLAAPQSRPTIQIR